MSGNIKRVNKHFLLGYLVYPESLADPGGLPLDGGKIRYVDGDLTPTGNGRSWAAAFNTITLGIAAADAFDVVRVKPKKITDFTGDPTSYAETVIIPADKPHLSIIGTSRGRTQGGLPQMKVGAGATAMITVRAAGCMIENMGINGISSTGGGILLDDDYSTKTAFGTTIRNCHIKNCVGSTATDSRTGGGIMWSVEGNAWQTSIVGNLFYKNVGDITLMGTSNTRPQDILIQGNEFKSAVASACDSNIYGAGSGFQTVSVLDNHFGDLPALGSGSIARYIDLTGTLGGKLAGNTFAAIMDVQGSEVTWGATGSAAKIPTTVQMSDNWGETTNQVYSGQIFRT